MVYIMLDLFVVTFTSPECIFQEASRLGEEEEKKRSSQ